MATRKKATGKTKAKRKKAAVKASTRRKTTTARKTRTVSKIRITVGAPGAEEGHEGGATDKPWRAGDASLW